METGYEIEINGEVKRGTVWFQSKAYTLKPSGAALLAVGFFPALSAGLPLTLEEPVSGKMLAHIPRLAEVFGCWLDLPRELTVHARRTQRPERSSRRTLCCFSAGVDSFYSSLHGLEPDAALRFISGFDIAADNRVLLETALGGVRENHDFVQRRGIDRALERALRYCRDQRFNRGLLRWIRKVWAWWRYT